MNIERKSVNLNAQFGKEASNSSALWREYKLNESIGLFVANTARKPLLAGKVGLSDLGHEIVNQIGQISEDPCGRYCVDPDKLGERRWLAQMSGLAHEVMGVPVVVKRYVGECSRRSIFNQFSKMLELKSAETRCLSEGQRELLTINSVFALVGYYDEAGRVSDGYLFMEKVEGQRLDGWSGVPEDLAVAFSDGDEYWYERLTTGFTWSNLSILLNVNGLAVDDLEAINLMVVPNVDGTHQYVVIDQGKE